MGKVVQDCPCCGGGVCTCCCDYKVAKRMTVDITLTPETEAECCLTTFSTEVRYNDSLGAWVGVHESETCGTVWVWVECVEETRALRVGVVCQETRPTSWDQTTIRGFANEVLSGCSIDGIRNYDEAIIHAAGPFLTNSSYDIARVRNSDSVDGDDTGPWGGEFVRDGSFDPKWQRIGTTSAFQPNPDAPNECNIGGDNDAFIYKDWGEPIEFHGFGMDGNAFSFRPWRGGVIFRMTDKYNFLWAGIDRSSGITAYFIYKVTPDGLGGRDIERLAYAYQDVPGYEALLPKVNDLITGTGFAVGTTPNTVLDDGETIRLGYTLPGGFSTSVRFHPVLAVRTGFNSGATKAGFSIAHSDSARDAYVTHYYTKCPAKTREEVSVCDTDNGVLRFTGGAYGVYNTSCCGGNGGTYTMKVDIEAELVTSTDCELEEECDTIFCDTCNMAGCSTWPTDFTLNTNGLVGDGALCGLSNTTYKLRHMKVEDNAIIGLYTENPIIPYYGPTSPGEQYGVMNDSVKFWKIYEGDYALGGVTNPFACHWGQVEPVELLCFETGNTGNPNGIKYWWHVAAYGTALNGILIAMLCNDAGVSYSWGVEILSSDDCCKGSYVLTKLGEPGAPANMQLFYDGVGVTDMIFVPPNTIVLTPVYPTDANCSDETCIRCCNVDVPKDLTLEIELTSPQGSPCNTVPATVNLTMQTEGSTDAAKYHRPQPPGDDSPHWMWYGTLSNYGNCGLLNVWLYCYWKGDLGDSYVDEPDLFFWELYLQQTGTCTGTYITNVIIAVPVLGSTENFALYADSEDITSECDPFYLETTPQTLTFSDASTCTVNLSISET